jgi:GNAT superfamily N-acetyltransferase
VAPEHRGRGAGQLLLEAVLTWARAAGARDLALDVTRGDTPAVRLYARAGFRPAGDPKPLRAGSPLTVQPMRLALNDALAPSA